MSLDLHDGRGPVLGCSGGVDLGVDMDAAAQRRAVWPGFGYYGVDLDAAASAWIWRGVD